MINCKPLTDEEALIRDYDCHMVNSLQNCILLVLFVELACHGNLVIHQLPAEAVLSLPHPRVIELIWKLGGTVSRLMIRMPGTAP